MCFGLLQEIAVAQKTLPQRSPGGKPVAGSFDIETPLFCGRFKFATESGNILHTEVSKGMAKSAYLRFRVYNSHPHLQFEILFCLQEDADNRLMATIQILMKKFPSIPCRVSFPKVALLL